MESQAWETDGFARATIHQAVGSRLRVVQFRGGDITYDSDDVLILSMGLTATHTLEYVTGGVRASVVPLIGRFGMMTPGRKFRISLGGNCRVLQLVLPRSLLTSWTAEDHEVEGERVEIAWGHTLDDPHVSRLLCAALAAGPQQEAMPLRLLTTRLVKRFSPQAPIAQARGGLPLHKVRQVIERIEDSPARMPTVEELARCVSVSPFHFAHQFRRSVGRPPHRFMIERKVSRAVALLGETKLSVAEIAAHCGFAHTSHLSRQFNRILGQSPAKLRQAIQL